MKKYIKYIVIFLVIAIATGCNLFDKNEKTYSSKGITVTMKDDFYEKTNIAHTLYLESSDVIFLADKESFSMLEEYFDIDKDSTLDEYEEIIKTVNQFDDDFKKDENLVYTTYERSVENNDYFYLMSIYKSDDAFWLVNFACLKEDKDKYESNFIKWAKTVKFDNQ